MVRPSARLIRPVYSLSILLGAVLFGISNARPESRLEWLLVIPAALLLAAFVFHLRLRFTTLTIGGNRIRLQTGFLSKATRTMELTKIQDVRVDQKLWQRLLGLGDLSIETAGESSNLRMSNIERPNAVADYILDKAHR